MSAKPKFAERFNAIEMFRYCEQCGRCSSACPITGVNEFNIRRLIRHVELDLIEDIASSPMPWFCAACGRCEDACPNGIKILDITRTLRAIGPGEPFPRADGPQRPGHRPGGTVPANTPVRPGLPGRDRCARVPAVHRTR
ncbi:MAG TPA: 4Fe-4S dicluster domain-containing protein [Desulfobacterales bacterium]|nr:4Fe-4S dicluster domain-containing protein [Desulfobacterales bacterium]